MRFVIGQLFPLSSLSLSLLSPHASEDILQVFACRSDRHETICVLRLTGNTLPLQKSHLMQH